MSKISEALEGKFFHTSTQCPNGHLQLKQQGRILVSEDDLFLVEVFSFADGRPMMQGLVRLSEFVDGGAFFYESAEDMRAEFDGDRFRHTSCECE
ncbi:hypothetical protein LT337_07270 [Mycolicibacterium fortuitum]|nr:hypothetical protein LT337_07270 [Mycolicibacterium fortuitum]